MLLLVATGIAMPGRGHAAARGRRPASNGTAPCEGTFLVKRKPLVGEAAAGSDAVVVEIAGAAEQTPPMVTVRSGCAPAAADVTANGRHTVVTAELSGCGGEGTATLRARIDARCETMRGRLRAGPASRPFLARRERAGVPGRVTGRVSARHGLVPIAIPGVQVFLRRRGGGRRHPAVETDTAGAFVLPETKRGRFDICATAAGFEPACAPELVELQSGTDAYRDIELVPVGGAVHGRVLLADGTPCFQPPTPLDGGVTADVRSAGSAARSRSNTTATYLLPGLAGAGAITIDVTCGDSHVAVPVTIGEEQLGGAATVDLTLPNSAPSITLLAASQYGVGVRSAAPGTLVDVVAEVTDVDGDALHYVWIDDLGGVTTVDAPVAQWTLQSVPASNVLTLLVSDGKGGYASRGLAVRGGDAVARFTGIVKGRGGDVVADAVVTVDGVAGATDAAGAFRLDLPEATQHVLTVKAPGFAPYAHTFDGESVGLHVELAPARRYVVDDPADGFEIRDGASGHVLTFPAAALVADDGTPATAPITVDVHTYEQNRGEFPGDRFAQGADGELHGLNLETCLWLAAIDAAGRRLQLAPDSRIDISFAVPAPLIDTPPEAISLMTFDETSGRWVVDGTAVHVDDRYKGQVGSLAPVGVAVFPDEGDACIRLEVDDDQIERPFRLLVQVSPFPVLGGKVVADIFVQEKTSALYGLPANAFATLTARPLTDTDKVLQVVTVATGANVKPANPPFPYAKCKPVTLRTTLPVNHWLDHAGVGSEENALDYYLRIGAIPAKDTFQRWLALNGFIAGDTASDVVFFNKNDLGLTRRLNCRKRTEQGQTVVGCYVTKFGEVGGNPDEMLQNGIDGAAPGDTVAMEYSFGGLRPERNTKFFIYGPDGKIKTKTAFDSQGYTKFVPTVCNYCHSQRHDSGFNLADVNGQFVTLDPHEYKFPASGPYSLDNQQERFRQLNEIISFAQRHTGQAWELMDSIYPSTTGGIGVHTPGTKARPAPVPDGWRDLPEVWSDVVKPSCRTCHMHLQPDRNFDDADDHFLGLGAQHVCTGVMPNAMAPMLRLWRTSDPFLPDLFSESLGGVGCGPTGRRNTAPFVGIITPPQDDLHVPYGGVNGFPFKAFASDTEDGSGCCRIDWVDDDGNVLGTGKELKIVLSKPGVTRVRAIAHDFNGTPSRAEERRVFADNVAPTLTINAPLGNGVFFRFVPYALRATLFDPNQDVSCSDIVWTGSNLPVGGVRGCEPFPIAFQTLGQHTLTASVTDAAGATTTKTRTVTVVEAPPHSGPVAVIFLPANGTVLNPTVATELGATLGDPDIDDCIADPSVCAGLEQPTFTWTVRFGANFEKEDKITPNKTGHFLWTPAKSKMKSCGPTPADLVFKATDADGKFVISIRRVTVALPPC
jgi:hypothetical protein